MEVLSGSRQRLKKQAGRQNKSQEEESAVSKSLSSTYRSFRDSDVSLQSFHLAGDTSISGLSHKSLTLTDIPEWTRRETAAALLHNNNNSSSSSRNNKNRSSSSQSIDTLHRSQSSILSTNTTQESTTTRSEIAVDGLLSCCSPEPPGGWPLVHRCLRTLSHGHWFHHWRKSSSSSFFCCPPIGSFLDLWVPILGARDTTSVLGERLTNLEMTFCLFYFFNLFIFLFILTTGEPKIKIWNSILDCAPFLKNVNITYRRASERQKSWKFIVKMHRSTRFFSLLAT